ncbi:MULTISPECIES: OmpA family protein [Croceitalea]|uniref:OmpA family protein n=1 Tax=Croceitalea vernalis TaxID=3075599 RepID=A0ABU3BEA5_9FLAO|nr:MULTISPECIES: OmpA family protein [unclassified Croceitalea]MDT0538710.1 OmpA family protein [Croceitalea sp. P059]MDT0620494.1 OmpA family protein [Croceitalea sp. P007]
MKKIVFLLACFSFIGLKSQTLTSLQFEEDMEPLTESKTYTNSRTSEVNALKALSKKRLKGVERSSYIDKVISKADDYFEKMWYSESAELYDLALKKNANSFSKELLQRAGDAHYFNGNMEKAHFWYSKLFDGYKNEVSDSDYFRYAHSLKGTGRYNRAKRILRIFNEQQITDEGEDSKRRYAKKLAEEMVKNIEIKNLNANSKFSDFSPMFHNENELVFASAKDSSFLNTRRYKWNNQPFLDLYVGEIEENKENLRNVKKFSKKVNSKYHEAAVTFAPDNKTMFLTRNNYGKKLKRAKNGVSHLKLYRSDLVDNEWTEPVELPFNSEEYSTGHPAMSSDGKRLFFVSDMPGGFGGTDLYVVDLLDNNKYSKPRNLGRAVNTGKREMFPFVTKNKLYFSSDRELGLGGLDIYESGFEDENFQVAVNVGQPINSNRDDFSYIADETGSNGYFASNRTGGKGDDDIYSFKEIPAEKEVVEEKEEYTNIVGVVKDIITGEAMPNASITLLDANNESLKEVQTDSQGRFTFNDLPRNTAFTIATARDEFQEESNSINSGDEEIVTVDVSLTRIDEMIVSDNGVKMLKTENIYFNFDNYSIREDAKKELDKLVQVWDQYPNMVIKIESHTDASGSKAYNRLLSDKRAKATKNYLLSKGIDKSRIYSAVGYGEQYPINDCTDGVNCDKIKHEQNRRSEFIIVSM